MYVVQTRHKAIHGKRFPWETQGTRNTVFPTREEAEDFIRHMDKKYPAPDFQSRVVPLSGKTRSRIG